MQSSLAQRSSTNTKRSIAWLIGTAALIPTTTFAQGATNYFDPKGYLNKNTGLPKDSPTTIALNLTSAFLSLLGIIALIMIIYGGFLILTGGGKGDKTAGGIKKGKDILTWAIIGSIIVLSSLGIVEYIDNFV
jgi:hypothetical protein